MRMTEDLPLAQANMSQGEPLHRAEERILKKKMTQEIIHGNHSSWVDHSLLMCIIPATIPILQRLEHAWKNRLIYGSRNWHATQHSMWVILKIDSWHYQHEITNLWRGYTWITHDNSLTQKNGWFDSPWFPMNVACADHPCGSAIAPSSECKACRRVQGAQDFRRSIQPLPRAIRIRRSPAPSNLQPDACAAANWGVTWLVESVESPDSHWKMRTLSQAVKRQGLPFCPQKSIKIPEGNHETKFQSIVNLSSNDSNVTLCILVWFCPSYLELFKGCLAGWQWPFMEIHH